MLYMCVWKDGYQYFLLGSLKHIKYSASSLHMANTSCLILCWNNNGEDIYEHVWNVYRVLSTSVLILKTLS